MKVRTNTWVALGVLAACGAPDKAPEVTVYDAVQRGATARYEVALGDAPRTVEVSVLEDGTQWIRIGQSDGATLGALIDETGLSLLDLGATWLELAPVHCDDLASCNADPIDFALITWAATSAPTPDRTEPAPVYRMRNGYDRCLDACVNNGGDDDCGFWCWIAFCGGGDSC
ncbi:MAG: hypothetical protein R3F59_07190 [Myxococcota bacterium]